jgi:Rod binding domain-containing protein
MIDPIAPRGMSASAPADQTGRARAPDEREAPLREAAKALEASFLAEMLKHSGLGAVPGAFGGGAGEEQFGSFLREAQARALVEAGGIGLGEAIFRVMAEAGDGRPV